MSDTYTYKVGEPVVQIPLSEWAKIKEELQSRRAIANTGEGVRANDEVLAIVAAIDELRREEGASVEILCDNPDFNGQPNNAVVCIADWTRYQEHRSSGHTLRGALENAVAHKRMAIEAGISALTSPPASAFDLPAPTEAVRLAEAIDLIVRAQFNVSQMYQNWHADAHKFLNASPQPATPAGGVEISGDETSLLAEMSKHVGWELDWGPKERNDEEGDYGWRLFERSGNRSDREWTLLGFGDTPRAALKSALEQGDGQ